jgi:hypothetical protein
MDIRLNCVMAGNSNQSSPFFCRFLCIFADFRRGNCNLNKIFLWRIEEPLTIYILVTASCAGVVLTMSWPDSKTGKIPTMGALQPCSARWGIRMSFEVIIIMSRIEEPVKLYILVT